MARSPFLRTFLNSVSGAFLISPCLVTHMKNLLSASSGAKSAGLALSMAAIRSSG
jgi:hypothetical protein